MGRRVLFVALVASSFLNGCAGLRGYEPPSVTITSVRMVPSDGAVPAFDIGLRVTNPNRSALRLQGISYVVSLDGNQVIEGVGRDFPVIEGYGQEDLRITATANLFAGIRLFTELLRSPRDSVDYAVEARLDLGGLRPSLRVRDEGSLSLSGVR